MKILGYEISVMPWRDRWCSNACLFIAVIFTIQGSYLCGWWMALRQGDSAIPAESELVWTGPFEMREIRQRNGSLVSFTRSLPSNETYKIEIEAFPEGFDRYVALHKGQPVAWLKLYQKNSFRPVWGVKTSSEEVMGYERALRNYLVASNPYPSIISGLGFLIIAFFSAFRITRINNRQGD